MTRSKYVVIGSIFCFAAILFIPSCLKNNNEPCTPNTPASEATAISSYAATNSINGTFHSSGLYYEITNTGSGATPTASSKVYVTYTGKLTNGTIFDQQTVAANTGWTLGGLIPAWQIGLSLIQKGGSIKLVVPSAMAYGCTGAGTIPANAILFFDITLVDVQ